MEVQIQELLDAIKRDGIAEGQKQAEQIISEATLQANEIVQAAKKEAAKLLEEARRESEAMQLRGKTALEQAARDVILSLKQSIKAHFTRLLEKKVEKILTGSELVSLIIAVVHGNLADPAQSTVELREDDFAALADTLREELADEIKRGLEIRPVMASDVGFRYATKDGSSYFDFSAQQIADLLMPFLNPSLAQIVEKAASER